MKSLENLEAYRCCFSQVCLETIQHFLTLDSDRRVVELAAGPLVKAEAEVRREKATTNFMVKKVGKEMCLGNSVSRGFPSSIPRPRKYLSKVASTMSSRSSEGIHALGAELVFLSESLRREVWGGNRWTLAFPPLQSPVAE